jgi:hypothetical protein
MTTIADTYTIDNGLASISGATASLTLCQTEPLTLNDCTSLAGSGGKRVTTSVPITGEVVLADGESSGSRKIVIPSKVFTDGVLVNVNGVGADLWLVVYDGARILLKTNDAITSQELSQGATVTTPSFDYGRNQ